LDYRELHEHRGIGQLPTPAKTSYEAAAKKQPRRETGAQSVSKWALTSSNGRVSKPETRLGSRRRKRQRQPVHAVAQAGRRGAVVKHVPEMAAAAPAVHFGAVDSHGGIGAGQHGVGQRLVEARPTSAALELGLGIEQRQGAAGAAKRAGTVFVEQRRTTRRLGALLAQDVVDVGAQPLPPFGIGEVHLVGGSPGGRRLGGN